MLKKWYPLQDGVVAITTGLSAYSAKVQTRAGAVEEADMVVDVE